MKRSLFNKFSAPFAHGNYVNEFEVPQVSMTESELDSVLKEIFSVDERTGLPKGDIQYFLSKDGNPQVKAWLETNLLSPRAKQIGSSLEGVTDDLIVEMSRNDGETASQYSERLMSLYDSAKQEYERLNKELNK